MSHCNDNFIVSSSRSTRLLWLSCSGAGAAAVGAKARRRRGARHRTGVAFDPVEGTGHAGVDTGVLSLSTTNTPAHHTNLLASRIDNWTTRVALATVLATTGHSCTQHDRVDDAATVFLVTKPITVRTLLGAGLLKSLFKATGFKFGFETGLASLSSIKSYASVLEL